MSLKLPDNVLEIIGQYLAKDFFDDEYDRFQNRDIVSLMLTCKKLYAIMKRLTLKFAMKDFESLSWEKIALFANKPQWKIIRLEMYYWTDVFSFIFEKLEELDANLWGHLKSVVLRVEMHDESMDDVYQYFIELIQILSLLNSDVKFYIVHQDIDFEYPEDYYDQLSLLNVTSFQFFHNKFVDMPRSWPEYFTKAGRLNQLINFSSFFNVSFANHLSNLRELRVQSLVILGTKTTCSLPSLQSLKISNQEKLCENFGDFISQVFPNLKFLSVFAELLREPVDIGLDKLPISCSKLAINNDMLTANSKLDSVSQLSLRFRPHSNFEFTYLEQNTFANLEVVELSRFYMFSGSLRLNQMLDLIKNVLECQPKLKILMLFSTLDGAIAAPGRRDRLISWLDEIEPLFESSEIELIKVGKKNIYMKDSLGFRTVGLAKEWEKMETDSWHMESRISFIKDDEFTPSIVTKFAKLSLSDAGKTKKALEAN